MTLKVKMFGGSNDDSIEDDMNYFLKRKDIKVKNIEYEADLYWSKVMILYEVDDK